MNCDIRLDIAGMDFEDNFFDVIICSHVLEYIQDDLKVMRELFRVLRPGGIAILQVPISKKAKGIFENFTIAYIGKKEGYFGQKDNVRIYGKDYKKILESIGIFL